MEEIIELADRLRTEHPDGDAQRSLQNTAADELEKLQKLLVGRDTFICDQGLWSKFVDAVETYTARGAAWVEAAKADRQPACTRTSKGEK